MTLNANHYPHADSAVRRGGARPSRAVLAASVGNLLEWFDFSVYALFAVYIGANFFPAQSPGAGLVKAFLVFGVGFVVRPLGSIVVGHYGDRAGRKSALTLTVLLMGLGTLIIAAAPPYSRIGVAAPLLLLAGRLLQGFSAGGEIGTAAAFLIEHAPRARKATVTAWLQASMGMSNILGALVGLGVSSVLTPAAQTDWGWRIPFCVGLLIVPLGLYWRRTLRETPVFAQTAAAPSGARPAPPVIAVFGEGAPALALSLGICILWAVAVYVLLIYLPVFVQKGFGFRPREAFAGSLTENLLFVCGCFLFGALADRIGSVRMLGVGAAGLLFGTLPLFTALDAHRTPGALLLVMASFGVLVAAFTSVAPTVLADLFPTQMRATGISIAYNVAFTVFGGFAPAILTWLTSGAAGSLRAPAWYVTSATVPAIVAIVVLRRGRFDPLIASGELAPLAVRESP